MKKHRILIAKILLIVFLLVLAFYTKSFTNSEREKVNLKPARKSASIEPSEVLSTKLIGPLRAFANISIWSRAREYEEEGEYFELVSLFSLAKKLQPRNPEVYSYLSNLLINTLSSKFTDDESRWSSVTRGIDILEDGLDKLPSSAMLHWNYALFFQNVTGRIPDRMIKYALEHENSIFTQNPGWRKDAEELLQRIKDLNVEEKFRFQNFCKDYGHTIIYGSKFKENPVYMTLSENLRQLVIDMNNTRVRMSFLSYLRSVREIGMNPMLMMYMMRRSIETCAINTDDIKPVYKAVVGFFKEISKLDQDQQMEKYGSAIQDFSQIASVNQQLYGNE